MHHNVRAIYDVPPKAGVLPLQVGYRRPTFDGPLAMTGFIKSRAKQASQAVRRGRPMQIVVWYCEEMNQLCRDESAHLNLIHVGAMLNGAAWLWTAAKSSYDRYFWTPSREDHQVLQTFAQDMLQWVHQFSPQLTSRSASNILWALSKLGVGPQQLSLETIDNVAQRFMADIQAATGQSYATVLLACAELQLNPCDGKMLPDLVAHMDSRDINHFDDQAVVNIMYSLANLPYVKSPPKLINMLCQSFMEQLLVVHAKPPQPQMLANFIWALQAFRHFPPRDMGPAMMEKMTKLCRLRQLPKSQEVSSFLLGCAELRFPVLQADADMLVKHLLSLKDLQQQEIANTAWGLAVSGCLKLQTYTELVDRMCKLAASPTWVSPNSLELRQMHQALDWLYCPSRTTAQGRMAWSYAEVALQRFGPLPAEKRMAGNPQLSAVLNQMGVEFDSGVQINSYFVHAVVTSQGSAVRPILILLEHAQDRFANNQAR